MFYRRQLDYHLVSDAPNELFMGELPRTYGEIPTRVIINLCGMYPAGEGLDRVILTLPMLDVMDAELIPDRDRFESFLDAAHMFAESESTYWHCHAGINRSGMAVAAYLHRHRDMRISDAIAHLRENRTPMVLCNSEFERTLRDWYGDPDEQEFEPFSFETWLVEKEPAAD